MAKKGLRAWVKENWVDIANRRKDGSYPKCGRSGGEKRFTGGYIGPAIQSNYGGKTLSNKSYEKYYGNMLKGFKR
jgi:hypothetical protein